MTEPIEEKIWRVFLGIMLLTDIFVGMVLLTISYETFLIGAVMLVAGVFGGDSTAVESGGAMTGRPYYSLPPDILIGILLQSRRV